jgi:rod shape-determining protein MreC
MVAARIVTDSRGPFANTRLANTGYEKGVKVGQPVMSENGLVGRVIGVTDGASRVLLLTDTASKVPVMIDRTNARAILQGDGGPQPKLDYLRGPAAVKEGDRVITSGDGGVIPRGLPVGTAVPGLDGRWRVVLAADKAPIDFVRILLFEDFTQLVNQKELAEKRVPPPTVGAETIGLAPPAPAAAPAAPAAPPAKPAAPPAATTSAPGAAAKPVTTTASPVAKSATTGVKASGAPAGGKSDAAKPPSPSAGMAKSDAKPAAAKPAAGKTEAKTTTTKPAAAKTDAKPAAPKPAAASGAAKTATGSAKPATPKPATAKPATTPPTHSKPAVDVGGTEPPH